MSGFARIAQNYIMYIYLYNHWGFMENKKYLLIEITPEEHQIIKRSALERYISMRKWVLEAIVEKIATEGRYR